MLLFNKELLILFVIIVIIVQDNNNNNYNNKKMNTIIFVIVLLFILEIVSGFRPNVNNQIRKVNGARSMTAVFDAIAGMALAAKLQTSTINPSALSSRSMPIAAVETRQGMYKEYSVDIKDDSKLDKITTNFKTAEQTEDSKTKV